MRAILTPRPSITARPSSPPFAATALLLACCWASSVNGQEETEKRLIDRPPFDRITLGEPSEGEVLEVQPVDLPGRTVPEKPKPTEKIRVRLAADPDKQYELEWRSIRKLELYEQRVLAEAERLVANGRFDDAFDYYSLLLSQYPNTPGLQASLQAYLHQNAGQLLAKQRLAQALGLFEELYSLNPKYQHAGSGQSVLQYIDSVGAKLIDGYLDDKSYSRARGLISRLVGKYGDGRLDAVSQRRDRLMQLAADEQQAARAHLDAGRLREAYEASQRMLDIWPTLPDASELLAEIARRYPIVVVGVTELAKAGDPARIDDWAVRRTGRLAQRLLFELAGPGPEGGQYACLLGTAASSEDRQQLTIRLAQSGAAGAPPEWTGYEVLQWLLDYADPNSASYSPAWGQLMKEARVEEVFRIQVNLRRPHVLPEGLLPIPIEQSGVGSASEIRRYSPYAVLSGSAASVRFAANEHYCLARDGQPAEVVERLFKTSKQGLAALQREEIQVLDRLLPADAARLRNDQSWRVKPYALPTIHMLVPNFANPYLASSTFRRALVCGINRTGILAKVLLGDLDLPGCRVISGPFPAGRSANDALAYAYDERIEPRGYDPELAFLLLRLALREVKAAAEKRNQKAPQLSALVLGYPAGESARLACSSIARQLKEIKIQCTLKELSPDSSVGAEADCDLRYVEAVMSDPVVDAGRLLGPEGVAAAGGAYVASALRQVEAAKNWREVRERLQNLHRIVQAEVTVIPLWQTFDYFAYSPRLEGLAERPVSLYQTVEQWRLSAP